MKMEFSEQVIGCFQAELNNCLGAIGTARQRLAAALLEQLRMIQYEPLKNCVTELLEDLNGLPAAQGDSPMTMFLERVDGRDVLLEGCRQWSRALEQRLEEEFRAFPLADFQALPAVSVKVSSGDYDGVSRKFQEYAQEVRELAAAYQSTIDGEENLILRIAETYVSGTYLRLAVQLAETAAEQMERYRREFEDKLEAANRQAQAAAEAAVHVGRQSGAQSAPGPEHAPSPKTPADAGSTTPAASRKAADHVGRQAGAQSAPGPEHAPSSKTPENAGSAAPAASEKAAGHVGRQSGGQSTPGPEHAPSPKTPADAGAAAPAASKAEAAPPQPAPQSKKPTELEARKQLQKGLDNLKRQYPQFYAQFRDFIVKILGLCQTEEEANRLINSYLAIGRSVGKNSPKAKRSHSQQQLKCTGSSQLEALQNRLKRCRDDAHRGLNDEYAHQEKFIGSMDRKLKAMNKMATLAANAVILGNTFTGAGMGLLKVTGALWAATTIATTITPEDLEKFLSVIPGAKTAVKQWQIKVFQTAITRGLRPEKIQERLPFISYVEYMLEVTHFKQKKNDAEVKGLFYPPLTRVMQELPVREAAVLTSETKRQIESCFIGSLLFLWNTFPAEEKGRPDVVSVVRPGKWEAANSPKVFYSLFLALTKQALQNTFTDQAFAGRVQGYIENHMKDWFCEQFGSRDLDSNINPLEFLEVAPDGSQAEGG